MEKIINIAELKQRVGVANSNISLLGYYSAGDGGGGEFYWDSTSTETDNGGTVIQVTGVATGRWKRIFTEPIFVKSFGIFPNIDYTNIYNSLNLIYKNIFFDKSTYKIQSWDGAATAIGSYGHKGFQIQSDTFFDGKGATFETITNSTAANVSSFRIKDVQNINLKDFTLIGERNSHIGTTGEGGYGIWCENVNNIVIDNVTSKDFWGDSLYLYNCNNVIVSNSTFKNSRRNNVSIIYGTNITFINCVFDNANGTSPQSGVDIEPDYVGQDSKNINFINCKFTNNVNYGLAVQGVGKSEDVVCSDCTFTGNKMGVVLNQNVKVKLNNCIIENNTQYGTNCINGTIDINNSILNKNDIAVINSLNTYISNSTISNSTQIGILNNNNNLLVNNCIFIDNYQLTTGSGGDIYLANTSIDSTIKGSKFYTNNLLQTHHIQEQSGSTGTSLIKGNEFYGFVKTAMIRCASDNMIIINNLFKGTPTTGAGIICITSLMEITGNTFNEFTGNDAISINVSSTNRNTFKVNNNYFLNVRVAHRYNLSTSNNVFTYNNTYRNVQFGDVNNTGGGNILRNATVLSNNEILIVSCIESGIPTLGSWIVGDIIYNSNISELGTTGSKYIIRGWICTVSGTPGTWLEMRSLTGN